MGTNMRYEIAPAGRITAAHTNSTLTKKLTVFPLNVADIIQIKQAAGFVEPCQDELLSIHRIYLAAMPEFNRVNSLGSIHSSSSMVVATVNCQANRNQA